MDGACSGSRPEGSATSREASMLQLQHAPVVRTVNMLCSFVTTVVFDGVLLVIGSPFLGSLEDQFVCQGVAGHPTHSCVDRASSGLTLAHPPMQRSVS